jgi:hypothetical protein
LIDEAFVLAITFPYPYAENKEKTVNDYYMAHRVINECGAVPGSTPSHAAEKKTRPRPCQ